jgi:hypothetical protein
LHPRQEYVARANSQPKINFHRRPAKSNNIRTIKVFSIDRESVNAKKILCRTFHRDPQPTRPYADFNVKREIIARNG